MDETDGESDGSDQKVQSKQAINSEIRYEMNNIFSIQMNYIVSKWEGKKVQFHKSRKYIENRIHFPDRLFHPFR